jgi:hypothetical protein
MRCRFEHWLADLQQAGSYSDSNKLLGDTCWIKAHEKTNNLRIGLLDSKRKR